LTANAGEALRWYDRYEERRKAMSTETITELNPQPEIDETLRKWLADYIAAHPEHTTRSWRAPTT
jgi:hypothetical protein